MKILGYIITFLGLGFLISSGKIQRWKTDGMPIWKHILYEILGTILICLGVTLIKG